MPSLSPHISALYSTLAEAYRPRPRVRPSEWVRANITLSAKQSADRPGAFDPSYLPWTRDVLDADYVEPWRLGVVIPKAAQVGITYAMLAKLLCLCDTDPGPALYMTDTMDKANRFGVSLLRSWIRANPRLNALFSAQPGDDTHRELLGHYEFPGGEIDCVGAGAASGIISTGRRYVFLDEFEAASKAFPAADGNLYETALARVARFRDSCKVYVFGHPLYAHEDIDQLYRIQSDQRSWSFDCPHCGRPFAPTWDSCVRLGASAADSFMVCPQCDKPISDAQRQRAVWPAERGGGGGGGSGRFISEMDDPAQARRRPYIGLQVNRLCDPGVTISALAARVLSIRAGAAGVNGSAAGVFGGQAAIQGGDPRAMLSFRSKELGEASERSSTVVSVADVAKRVQAQETILLPGGDQGVHLLAAGVDVQAPVGGQLTLVTTLMAFTAGGHAFLVGAELIRGWGALFEYLGSIGVRRGDANGQIEMMGVDLCSIDCGNWTREVLDECRRQVISRVSGAIVPLLPVRFSPYVKATRPAVMPDEAKRVDPARPWLGPQERYDLDRDTWVDRGMNRWMHGTVTVWCQPPKDLLSHVTAQTRVVVRDKFGQDTGELRWVRMKNRVDDWLMAMVYAEAGAAVKLGLDRLHERMSPVVAVGPQEPVREDPWYRRQELTE